MQDEPGPAHCSIWTDSPLIPSIQQVAALNKWAEVSWGDPGQSDGWYRYEALDEPSFRDRLLEQISGDFGGPPPFIGTRLFRIVHFLPLVLAGYIYAADGRVVRLRGNIALRNGDHTGRRPAMRLLEPRALVAPEDPAAGTPGLETIPARSTLADALFAEVPGLAEPLMEALVSRGLITRAAGWGILLDFLATGFLAAGRTGLGLDAAWALWAQAVEGRSFPVRRMPRRLQYTVDGKTEEIVVQAHCCLRYTLPRFQDQEDRYCTNCYLESDEKRVARLIQSRQNAGSHHHHHHH